jgi:hypothetical protein
MCTYSRVQVSLQILYLGSRKLKGDFTECFWTNLPYFGRLFLRTIYNDTTKHPIYEVEALQRQWREKKVVFLTFHELRLFKMTSVYCAGPSLCPEKS